MADKHASFPQATRDWLATLSLEELAAFDASREFGNQEMMAEVQRKLPERLRFGGEFGLPSALGYGKDADSRAQIRNYLTPELGFPTIMGGYTQSARAMGLTPEELEELEEKGKVRNVLDDPLIEFISSAPDYDASTGSKGISVFQPTGRNSMERAFNTAEGYVEKGGERHSQASTISHELTHKFFNSPAFLDFLEETGYNQGKPFTGKQEHNFIESAEPIDEDVFAAPTIRKIRQKHYSELLDGFRAWLTPEREEKYGIRLSVQSVSPEYPSTLDKLIDFIRGQ